MENYGKRGLVLVAGATGGIGYHTVKELLTEGYQVRILCRDTQRAKEVFGEELFSKIEGVYTTEIDSDLKKMIAGENDSYLRKAFSDPAKDTGLMVEYVVTTIGAGRKNQNPQMLDFRFNRHLIDLSKDFKIKKFIYISACFITKPYSIVAYFLNTIFKNVLGFKLQVENCLRESGLNYVIVRPPKLKQYKDSPTTAFRISQGDQLSFYNKIKRGTVGKIVVKALMSEGLPSKVTFECYSTSSDLNQPFSWNVNQERMLVPDGKEDICEVDHFKATKRIRIGLRVLASLMILAGGVYFSRKYQHHIKLKAK